MLLLLLLLILMPLLLLLLIRNKWVCRLCLLGCCWTIGVSGRCRSCRRISSGLRLFHFVLTVGISYCEPSPLVFYHVLLRFSRCLCFRIELSELPVAIKTISAIAEVSRPAIEAAVYFGRRGMILVTPLVYGFNFRGVGRLVLFTCSGEGEWVAFQCGGRCSRCDGGVMQIDIRFMDETNVSYKLLEAFLYLHGGLSGETSSHRWSSCYCQL
ncbi:uncharacterized protein LOC107463414 isoform X2 [Arachis duranensis]|nr:uncharacterized protein LOC107463414 isoform X2 [Arachis duranensis]